MKVLQVIDQGFRTLTEEQDDTILWLTGSMRAAGADVSVLLGGNAVCYAVQRQRQPRLSIGDWQQQQPASLPRDICQLVEQGVSVYVLEEELKERGLQHASLIPGVTPIVRRTLEVMYSKVDQVWNW